jgi:stage V sporulation protein R
MSLLPSDLAGWQTTIEGYARDFGLDFSEIRYEMLDYRVMNEIAAYDGFPIRYPHWRFGMAYDRLSKSYAYGLHRIYEMVINTDPCYAYLLTSNQMVDQKLVMAHVCGHADFFKNNFWFQATNRKMLDEIANHAARLRLHIERQGLEQVESFLDACLSLDNLIDVHAAGIRRRPAVQAEPDPAPTVRKLPSKNYMDSFINPQPFLVEQQRQLDAAAEQHKRVPEEPERDGLLFLLEHAPLENWQHDVLDIVREEAYYFAPQAQTKIMNEGWASFVHSHLMTERILDSNEVIDYAEHHASTMANHPEHLNPYKLGLELLRDIEDRWNRGAFGSEYEACDTYAARRKWDRQLGLGRQKVFEVRRIYNDVGFIDEFLTEDFVRENGLFTYDYNTVTHQYEIASRDFDAIKNRLLFQLTNFGRPLIDVVEGNYENRGELYLVHRYDGVGLDLAFARDTLRNLYLLWSRPVHIETFVPGDGRVLLSCGPQGDARQKLS